LLDGKFIKQRGWGKIMTTAKSRRIAWKQALVATSALTMLGLAASSASAVTLTADGALDAGYQLGYSVGFIDDQGNAVGDGRMFFGISGDGSMLFYFQMPLNYVDNTYGANASSDWGKKGHTFNDLLGSDAFGSDDAKKGGVGFGFNGNEIKIDYIAGVKCTTKGCTDDTAYRSGGVGTALNDGATDSNDGKIITGNVDDILQIATSLEYDLNTFGVLKVDSGTDPGWIKEVGYEVQFKPGTFDADAWLDPNLAYKLITLGSPHASPSKFNFSEYGDPICIVGCSPVPEAPTLPLMGGALAALGLSKLRRRRRKS
jgi:MYXO-CTERM domain-containing protein